MSWPLHRRYSPVIFHPTKQVDFSTDDTPFGPAYWQVFSRDHVSVAVNRNATDLGVDARAAIHVEPMLRWLVSERESTEREPVVLAHSQVSTVYPSDFETDEFDPTDRKYIRDGLIFVVATQIVLPGDAWHTYRELFTQQPISASLGSMVVTAAINVSMMTERQIQSLGPVEKRRRDTMLSKFGAVGESMFTAYNSAYPTTLDMIAHTCVASPLNSTPVASSSSSVRPPSDDGLAVSSAVSMVDSSVSMLRDDAEDSDDMTLGAIANRQSSAPVRQLARSAPLIRSSAATVLPPLQPEQATVLPPAVEPQTFDSNMTAWRKSCIENGKYRVNLIFRGYLSLASVRYSRRITSATGDLFYVVPSSMLFGSAALALAHGKVVDEEMMNLGLSHPNEPVSNGVVDGYEPQPATPQQPHVTNIDDDNDNDNQPNRMHTEQPTGDRVMLPLSVPIWERHLLDRLSNLDMKQLTFYEVDCAIRDRFSIHTDLYSFVRAGTQLENRSAICAYPKSYRSPILQPYERAPGLLKTAQPYDYAAIGLAGLCVVAAMEPELTQWLLDAEAYYFRLMVQHKDPTSYVTRVYEQIQASKAPPEHTELYRLLVDIIAKAKAVIAGVDEEAADESSDSEDDAADDDPEMQLSNEEDELVDGFNDGGAEADRFE